MATNDNKQLRKASEMDIIKTVTSPQRKRDMYSSQKHLVDDEDNSDEVIVGTLHDTKSSSIVEKLEIIDRDELEGDDVEDSIPEIPDLKIIDDDIVEIRSDSPSVKDTDESDRPRLKIKRSRKNKFKYEKFKNQAVSSECHETKPIKTSDNTKVIGVHVLSSDILENDIYLIQPFVKIYIVNCRKENDGKKVAQNDIVDFTIDTKSFDCYKNRSIIPKWDEVVLFKNVENVSWSDMVIFFEIMDRNKNSGNYLIDQRNNCKINDTKTKSIAWAFIKPIGFGGSQNINKILKLQLYENQKLFSQSNKPNVYHYWKLKPWKKYPSVLNVIVLGTRSKNFNEKYSLLTKRNEINKNKYILNKVENFCLNNLNMKKRLPDEPMEVPNKIISTLENGDGLTTTVKFSPCGKFLAFSSMESNKHVVQIYKIPEFEIIKKLSHHKGLVYEICWNSKSSQIVTASADNTACVWSINDDLKWTRQQLEHPSFVYAARFCKFDEKIIATGCYDGLIRIWSSDIDDFKCFKLRDELTGHTGYVNVICFMDYNEAFFSADSEGNIFKWARGKGGWINLLEFNVNEFRGKVINDLILLRDNKKMLVVIRNDTPWLLNLSSSVTSVCYDNGVTSRYLIRGCVSHCETFVTVGGNIWKTSTGELCAIINPIEYDHHPITSSDLHPFFNLNVLSCGRRNAPVILCYHLHKCDIDVNLRMEIYLSDMIDCNRTSDEMITLERHDNKKFKNTVLKLNPDLKKNKHLKLWDLLKKMDDLITMAKHARDEESETESSKIDSLNLNTFSKRIDRISSEQNGGSKSDSSQVFSTYTVENEKKPSTVINNGDLDHSSTASNIESLEDDHNTYTVDINHKSETIDN